MKGPAKKRALAYGDESAHDHHAIDHFLQHRAADPFKAFRTDPSSDEKPQQTYRRIDQRMSGKKSDLGTEIGVEDVGTAEQSLQSGDIFTLVLEGIDAIQYDWGTGHREHSACNAADGTQQRLYRLRTRRQNLSVTSGQEIECDENK